MDSTIMWPLRGNDYRAPKDKMESEFTIRSAIPVQDSAALFTLMYEIYKTTEMMCEALSEKYPDQSILEEDLKEYAGLPGALFLVAEANSKLSGYVCAKPLRQSKLAHTAYLNMGIASNSRGKQLGRTLLEAAMQKITNDGIIEIVYLNVRADNEPAVRLYESSGFETIAVLDRDTKYNGQYFTGLLMRRFV